MSKAVKVSAEMLIEAGPPIAGAAVAVWRAVDAIRYRTGSKNMDIFSAAAEVFSPSYQVQQGKQTAIYALSGNDSHLAYVVDPLLVGAGVGLGARAALWTTERVAGRQGGAALRKLEKKTIVTI